MDGTLLTMKPPITKVPDQPIYSAKFNGIPQLDSGELQLRRYPQTDGQPNSALVIEADTEPAIQDFLKGGTGGR